MLGVIEDGSAFLEIISLFIAMLVHVDWYWSDVNLGCSLANMEYSLLLSTICSVLNWLVVKVGDVGGSLFFVHFKLTIVR